MRRINFDKSRDVSFRIDKANLTKSMAKFLKPCTRCLFAAVKRLMQMIKMLQKWICEPNWFLHVHFFLYVSI